MVSQLLEIGFVSGVFGVRGEVRLHLHNRESSLFKKPRPVTLRSKSGETRSVTIKARSGAGKRVIGRIDGVDSREAALALKDWLILVQEQALPEPQADEFYVYKIVGAEVFVDGERRGIVKDVHSTGPVDLFEVVDGEDTQFVPALKELVLEMDLTGGRLVLAEGSLE